MLRKVAVATALSIGFHCNQCTDYIAPVQCVMQCVISSKFVYVCVRERESATFNLNEITSGKIEIQHVILGTFQHDKFGT